MSGGLKLDVFFCLKEEGPTRNRSLFIMGGGGGLVEDFGGIT